MCIEVGLCSEQLRLTELERAHQKIVRTAQRLCEWNYLLNM